MPDPLFLCRVIHHIARLSSESEHNLVYHDQVSVEIQAHERANVGAREKVFWCDNHYILFNCVVFTPLIIGKHDDRALVAVVVPSVHTVHVVGFEYFGGNVARFVHMLELSCFVVIFEKYDREKLISAELTRKKFELCYELIIGFVAGLGLGEVILLHCLINKTGSVIS